jgi:hypothetical protein
MRALARRMQTTVGVLDGLAIGRTRRALDANL